MIRPPPVTTTTSRCSLRGATRARGRPPVPPEMTFGPSRRCCCCCRCCYRCRRRRYGYRGGAIERPSGPWSARNCTGRGGSERRARVRESPRSRRRRRPPFGRDARAKATSSPPPSRSYTSAAQARPASPGGPSPSSRAGRIRSRRTRIARTRRRGAAPIGDVRSAGAAWSGAVSRTPERDVGVSSRSGRRISGRRSRRRDRRGALRLRRGRDDDDDDSRRPVVRSSRDARSTAASPRRIPARIPTRAAARRLRLRLPRDNTSRREDTPRRDGSASDASATTYRRR
mmetsp:Transcript_49448/g.149011  ORF Transcript_49448/g.149011 Transcript_49448/m.149011 type:complete len:286 (-) Transcript_49448:407-1264(-)